MKKVIFALAAVVALAACSNEETTIKQSREAINFNDAFVENTTRAIDPSITTGTISSFKVYGTTQGDEKNANGDVIAPVVNIYSGVDVTKAVVANGIGNADSWWYEGDYVQYWIEGNTYNFAAVVNGTVDTDDATGMPETISYAADGVTDLLYAEYTTTGQKTGNATVGFTFDHLLSKVKFTFKNTSAAGSNDNYTYKVTGLQITGTPASGEYTVANYLTSNDAWTRNNSATTTYGHIVDKDEDDDDAVAIDVAPGAYGVSNYERLVIPGTYNINVKCRIALLYNDEEVDVTNYNENVDVTFADGCAYNLVLSGSVGEQIMFTCTKVNDWDTDHNDDGNGNDVTPLQ